MTITETTRIPTAPTIPHRRAAPRSDPGSSAASPGLTFVASVIAQNVLRAQYPANDASATKVMAFYAEHRSLALVLAVLFPIGLVGIAGASSGRSSHRVAHGEARMPAIAGLIGAAGIVGNFTMLLAGDTRSPGTCTAVPPTPRSSKASGSSTTRSSACPARLDRYRARGLRVALCEARLLAARWKTAGLVGGVLLLVAAATTPAIIDAGPTMLLGLLGFVVWVAFVARASVALLRTPAVASRSIDPHPAHRPRKGIHHDAPTA